jgi:hypothetical protein
MNVDIVSSPLCQFQKIGMERFMGKLFRYCKEAPSSFSSLKVDGSHRSQPALLLQIHQLTVTHKLRLFHLTFKRVDGCWPQLLHFSFREDVQAARCC